MDESKRSFFRTSTRFPIPLVLFFALLSACAHNPTEVKQNPSRILHSDAEMNSGAPIVLSETTKVIDVRPNFDFTTAHIPRSVNLQWNEFSQSEPAQVGVLQADAFAIARRLARLGIEPSSQVLVVGDGLRGSGEEGRVAWMLAYLGLKNVQFIDFAALKGPVTNVDAAQIKNAPLWKPEINESLLATREEVLHVLNKSGVYKSTVFKNAPAQLYKLIDVRSPREYLNKEGLGLTRSIPNMEAINIEWKEFLTPQGRPNLAFAEKLRAVGITADQRILVFDTNGVRSGEVTMALKAMGFVNVANYSGGLLDLLSR
jgi:thiosulfate/3-mercaptopyruvate sulfurtransferase